MAILLSLCSLLPVRPWGLGVVVLSSSYLALVRMLLSRYFAPRWCNHLAVRDGVVLCTPHSLIHSRQYLKSLQMLGVSSVPLRRVRRRNLAHPEL